MEDEKEQHPAQLDIPQNPAVLRSFWIVFLFFAFLFSIGLLTRPFFPALKGLKNYIFHEIFKKPDFGHTVFNLDTIISKELTDLGLSKDQIQVQISQNVDAFHQEWTSYLYEIKLPPEYNFSDIQQRFYQAIKSARGRLFEVYKGEVPQEVFVLTLGIEQTITHTLRFIKQTLPDLKESLPPALPGPEEKRPQVAIVMDDVGFSEEAVHKILQLGEPFTFAIIPHLEKSVAIAELLNEKKQEIILHIPMEPEEDSFINLGKGGLWTHMSNEQIRQTVREDIEAVPYIKGVSNHMGSRFTTRAEKMRVVLEEIKKYHLFFLDSRTSSQTVGYQLARKMGLRSLERDIFLDDVEELNAIRAQLKKVENLALRDGRVIAIGHPRSITIEALRLMLPEFKKKNIEMVGLSKLIDETQTESGHQDSEVRNHESETRSQKSEVRKF
ncbi:MAG TPA: divergent polysaccharide deacetylase family protein [Candidatus Limnocylindrales bacterium]|nr:divergent polysaccharide deacetylase family protein [Candidatus Limnocylindrales bacterium]